MTFAIEQLWKLPVPGWEVARAGIRIIDRVRSPREVTHVEGNKLAAGWYCHIAQ